MFKIMKILYHCRPLKLYHQLNHSKRQRFGYFKKMNIIYRYCVTFKDICSSFDQILDLHKAAQGTEDSSKISNTFISKAQITCYSMK